MDAQRAARRDGWRLMASAVRPQKRWVVGGIAAGGVWTLAKLAVPLLAAAAVDDGMRRGDTTTVVVLTLVMVVVGVVQALGTGMRRYAAFRIALRVETDIRQRLFAHLQSLHFAFHDRAQTGQLMARANTDIQQINNVIVLLPLAAASMLTVVGVLVIMLTKSWVLTVLTLAALPFLSVAAARFSHRITPVNRELQEELASLSEVVEESISGIRVVKGFGAERRQVQRLVQEADDVLDRGLAAARLRAGFMPLIDFLPTLAMVAILWYGGRLVLSGRLQVGEILAFSLYILMLIWPLRMMGMLIAQASRASASGGRIHEVLMTEPEIRDIAGARALSDGPGGIELRDVHFEYIPGTTVLSGFDLTIAPGESVALVGATGSGKTTVARLLARFYEVDAGAVLIDGQDVRELRVADVRAAVGIVFEDTFLFTGSIRDNIAFARPDASLDVVRRAAALAGADGFVEALPEAYETVIGEHGYSLSGGQRQRVAIARAVLADPRVLILDDATSAVDPTKENEIRTALREVMRDRTTVIIAHRPATVALADRVVLVGDGRVKATGTHGELLASNAEYRAVLAEGVRVRSDAVADGTVEAAG